MNLREAAQQALDALELAGMSHDVMLMSDPPQDAWKARSVNWKLAEAMNALRAALAETHTSADTEYTPVEPVAYVSGFSKGRCIIEAVDPDWLLPVGMALYRSPGKRKPLTAPQIHELDWPDDVAFEDILKFTRAIEQAHGIGGEE